MDIRLEIYLRRQDKSVVSSVIFHCSRSIFGQIIGNFTIKMLFSTYCMVCITMDDRNYHGIFGRLLMDKEKELKEHIEKRERILVTLIVR